MPWFPEHRWAQHHGGPPRGHKRGPFLPGHRHNPTALTASIDSQQRRSRCVSGGERRVSVHSAHSLRFVRSQAARKPGPRPLCPSPSASPRLSPRLVHARAPDGLRRTGFCPSSLSLAAAQGRTRHTLSTKGETWAWSRTTPFGGHATRRRQSRDSAEASGLPFRVPSLCHGAQRSVNPTRCKNYQGRAWAGAGGRGIRTAAVGAPGALLRRGRGTRESQRCSASSRGQADSRGSGTWRSGPWKALLPTEITFSISRLSLQTETSVAQPQAPVMSPFLFSLDC